MKKTLITGGMGLIGKALVRKLLSETDEYIVIVDNLSSSQLDKDIIASPRINFIEASFEKWIPIGFEFSKIYHLTSPVGPLGVLKYKGRIAQMILEQLYRAADLAIEHNAKLMEISTSEVYGAHPESEVIGQRESLSKIVPSTYTVRLEYGIAKLLCEIVLENLARDNRLKYICIRPFNIVGPKQNDELGFIIPRFLRQMKKGLPLTVYGDGTQKRTFTHVDDFVDGIFLLMESNVNKEIFNIGNPENTTTINDLAIMMINKSSYLPGLQYVDPTLLFKDFAEAWNKIPNVDKLYSVTGFKPYRTLDYIVSEALTDPNYLLDL